MELSEEQQNFIDDNFHKIPDLIELTRAVFKDGTIDGRSKEGRAVRKYLSDNNVKYKTTEEGQTRGSVDINPKAWGSESGVTGDVTFVYTGDIG